MKLNKGDIVEIIKKDEYDGLTYEVGTKWIVTVDHPNKLIINVHDPRHPSGEGLLGHKHVKKVKKPKQNYKFKLGQIFKVIAKDEESPFSYDKFYAVQPASNFSGNYILSNSGIRYYANDFGDPFLNTKNTYLELVDEIKETEPELKSEVKEPTIEVQFLLDYIETEDLCSAEIKAFLKGYLKGERFKND